MEARKARGSVLPRSGPPDVDQLWWQIGSEATAPRPTNQAAPRPPRRPEGPVFVLRLTPRPGVSDPIRALRAALKVLLRRGLRCVSAYEEAAP